MQKKLNITYGGIQGAYWMIYATVISFASAFLIDRGYSNSLIGVIFSLGNILSFITQPLLAAFADSTKKVSVIGITGILSALSVVFFILLYIFPGQSVIVSAIFVMLISLFFSMQAFISSICFYLEKTGYNINFGITRSVGSLLYAILCIFMGSFIEKYGTVVIIIVGLVTSALLMLALMISKGEYNKVIKPEPTDTTGDVPVKTEEDSLESAFDMVAAKAVEKAMDGVIEKPSEKKQTSSIIGFAKSYKMFLVFMLGIACIFFAHLGINNFLLQIITPIGGNTEDLGSLFSYAALLELPAMLFFQKLAKKFGCAKLLSVAAIFFIVKVFLAFIAKDVTFMYVSLFFQSLSFAIFTPASVQFASEVIPEYDSVKAQAFTNSMVTVGSIFSSFFGGLIIDVKGTGTFLLIGTILTIIGAILMIYSCNVLARKKYQ